MTTFTPGPWVASQYLDNGEWGILRDPKNDDMWDGGEIVVGTSSRITEANAHLIAAAPDLLDALGRALFHATLRGWATTEDHELNGVYQQMKAAIAKAEGREVPKDE